jgi:hypothetical protein
MSQVATQDLRRDGREGCTEGQGVGLGLGGYLPPALVFPVALVEGVMVEAVEMIHLLPTLIAKPYDTNRIQEVQRMLARMR